ncbi:MAG: transposase [Candidatus Omnitrophica bacterium]|nr:transposase [Candidatus Omnitrophota bacterium]MBU1810481.1 transposase [Candidatus Omnitrophota bacterium]
MPRQARIVVPDTPHHVTQRGNYQQKVFDHESHYKQYCEWMNDCALECDLKILAYCLMDNHVHFITVPKKEIDLAKVFKTIHARYAHYMNKQRGVKGHLWQGRFYSCILGDTHLYRAIRYTENNPVRIKKVRDAWEYEWSSASDHVGNREKGPIKLTNYETMTFKEWRDYLKENDRDIVDEIRLKTNRGLAVGTDKFVKALEKTLNRSLKYSRQGRPAKER